MKPSCDECGQPHPGCNGHPKHARPKRPCLQPPKENAPVCRKHGGAAPQVVAKAERTTTEIKIRKGLGMPHSSEDLDPIEVAAELQRRARTRKMSVEHLQDQLTSMELEDALTSVVSAVVREDGKDFDKLLLDMARLGLDERAVQIQEAELDLLTGALVRIIRALGHDPEEPHVAEIIHAELRALDPEPDA